MVDGGVSELLYEGARQGVKWSWLCNIFMDRQERKMNATVGNVGARLYLNGEGWTICG